MSWGNLRLILPLRVNKIDEIVSEIPFFQYQEDDMARCVCTAAEAVEITKDPWHTQTIDQEPFVGEIPMEAIQNWITPTALYYACNHFEAPTIDAN